jgi:hypothetical protein
MLDYHEVGERIDQIIVALSLICCHISCCPFGLNSKLSSLSVVRLMRGASCTPPCLRLACSASQFLLLFFIPLLSSKVCKPCIWLASASMSMTIIRDWTIIDLLYLEKLYLFYRIDFWMCSGPNESRSFHSVVLISKRWVCQCHKRTCVQSCRDSWKECLFAFHFVSFVFLICLVNCLMAGNQRPMLPIVSRQTTL